MGKNNLILLPQWLPSIAWYFGGSVELEVFCDDRAVEKILEYNFPICLISATCLCVNQD